VAYTRTRDWATVDYYAALGVDEHATEEDIARAFRALAKQLHPDAGAPSEVAERFKEVSAAYEVLGHRRTRRDYDAVRAGVLPAPRARAEAPEGAVGAPPRFRAAATNATGWTARRAHAAIVGGLLVLVFGIVVSFFVAGLQRADNDRRAGRIAVTAQRVAGGERAEVEFMTRDGERVVANEPEQQNPGVRRTTVDVLYDPAQPTDVIADENYLARNITLWIVAVKLLVGGPILAAYGWHARQRQLRSSATPA
jgi:hypothetical protein